MTANAAANMSRGNFRVASRFALTLLLSRKLCACKAWVNAWVGRARVLWAGPCKSFVSAKAWVNARAARVLDAIGVAVAVGVG